MTCYFISGHLDLTVDEFDEHYTQRIHRAIDEGASFVVGDARGCDNFAHAVLSAWKGRLNVRLFHMLEAPRNNRGFVTVGGFASDDERDQAMTAASTHDIAWVRPGRENSGTARNLARRALKR